MYKFWNYVCPPKLPTLQVISNTTQIGSMIRVGHDVLIVKNQTALFPLDNLAEPDVMYFANSRNKTIYSSWKNTVFIELDKAIYNHLIPNTMSMENLLNSYFEINHALLFY